MNPGRWNRHGELVVYAAPTLAMATLETAAHVDDHGLPLNKYVIQIEVPDDVWDSRLIKYPSDLPAGWDAIPAGVVSFDAGSVWYASKATVLLELPSAIVPEESTLLINAEHPQAKELTARATRRFEYNRLFRPK